MTKEIMDIIKRVEDFEIDLDNTLDPGFYEVEFTDGPEDVYIVHRVEGHPELELFFAEFDHVKEVNGKRYTGEIKQEEADEFFREINEPADQFDYDRVAAYSADQYDNIHWL